MGEFLALSGVAVTSRRDVVRSLEEFASSTGGHMSPAPGGGEPFEHLVISGGEDGPVTVLYPSEFIRSGTGLKPLVIIPGSAGLLAPHSRRRPLDVRPVPQRRRG